MNSRKLIILLASIGFVGLMGQIASCTREDDEVVLPTPDPALELIAKQVSTAPTIDGTIDGMWSQMPSLVVTAEVPDPGNKVFNGYVGQKYEVTMRAAYDANFIYFLAEWNDLTKNFNRQTWYFDPDTKLWKQEDRSPIFENGVKVRNAFYEDKFALLFNVSNSVENWNLNSCYSSCHTGLSPEEGLARHYTNGTNERIDMWHWKGTRTNINGQFDDQYQNNDFPNGRHGDAKNSGGYTDNKQTLYNGVTNVTVPKYLIPTRTYYYWITQDEIDAGTAKLITGVDADGVLTYNGGTIDPAADASFQRDGSSTGSKCIPSIYTTAFDGSRGDITAVGVHVGSGWVLEFKRALKTGDAAGQDVDFSSLQDQVFGIGVFDNAGIAHAIRPGLLLTFE